MVNRGEVGLCGARSLAGGLLLRVPLSSGGPKFFNIYLNKKTRPLIKEQSRFVRFYPRLSTRHGKVHPVYVGGPARFVVDIDDDGLEPYVLGADLEFARYAVKELRQH